MYRLSILFIFQLWKIYTKIILCDQSVQKLSSRIDVSRTIIVQMLGHRPFFKASVFLYFWNNGKRKKKERSSRRSKGKRGKCFNAVFSFLFSFFLAGKKLARKKGTLRWHQRVTRRQLWRPFRKISKIAREVKLYCVLRHDCNFITPLRKCIILKVNIHINYILYVIN